MKKFIAILMAVILVCSIFTVTALASGTTSPEQGNTGVEVPPSSPQTGGLNIGWIIALAVALCAVAVVAVLKLKKARG